MRCSELEVGRGVWCKRCLLYKYFGVKRFFSFKVPGVKFKVVLRTRFLVTKKLIEFKPNDLATILADNSRSDSA